MPDIRAILAKHCFAADNVVPVDSPGIANDVWFAGDLVVRVSKDPEYESDAYTESVAAPVAWRAGVHTPKPLVFDFDRDLAPGPVSIYRRAEGILLTQTKLPDPGAFYHRLGQELAVLHRANPVVDDPNDYLDVAWSVSLDDIAAKCRQLTDRRTASEALELATHLNTLRPPHERRVFAHQDLHAENLLVAPDGRPVLLDWGDAGWGEPAVDFRYVPVRHLSAALAGYGDPDPAFRADCLVHAIDQFLYCQVIGRTYGPDYDSTWAQIREDATGRH